MSPGSSSAIIAAPIGTQQRTRLAAALPCWDRRERHWAFSDVPPAAVLRAADEVTWREVPVFWGLMKTWSLGCVRLAAGEPVLALFTTAGFAVLDRTEDEIVVGGIGRDSIAGGEGRDRIFGGDDRDQLVGGADADVVRGQSGKDRCAPEPWAGATYSCVTIGGLQSYPPVGTAYPTI